MLYAMHHTISALFVKLPELIAQGGYWLTFIIVLLEGLPLLGSIIPGHIVIIAAGFLSKVGVFSFPIVFIIILCAVLIGDLIGYSMGKKYGYPYVSKFARYLYLKEEHIQKLRNLIEAHVGKALILGKFSPLSRPLSSFLVGAGDIPPKTFWIYNTAGAVLWISLSLILGYLFGASYDVAAQTFGKFIVVALIATVLIVWSYRFINMRFHVFKKYELIVLGLNLVSLWILAKTIQDAASAQSFLINFDISVNLFMAEHVTPWVASLATFITDIGSTSVTAGLGFIIGIYFLLYKKWRRAGIMLLSIGSTSVALFVLKELFMRARPGNALQVLSDPSFPSGHAGLAAAFFVVIAYIMARHITSWVKREIVIVLCVCAVIVIGFSRVILNVHWSSDVIAGWSLGIFLSTGSILFVRYVGGLLTRNNK